MGVVALIAGWIWATRSLELSIPAARALEGAVEAPRNFLMVAGFALFVVWALLWMIDAVRARNGATQGSALERVTNQPAMDRAGKKRPFLVAVTYLLLWTFVGLGYAPQALQLIVDHGGLKAAVAGGSVLAFTAIGAWVLFTVVRRALFSGRPAEA